MISQSERKKPPDTVDVQQKGTSPIPLRRRRLNGTEGTGLEKEKLIQGKVKGNRGGTHSYRAKIRGPVSLMEEVKQMLQSPNRSGEG